MCPLSPGKLPRLGAPGRRRLAAAILAGAACFVGPGASADDLSGRARTVDGATIEIAGRRLRIAGLASPDASWVCLSRKAHPYDCAGIARDTLDSFIRGVTVSCTPVGRDRCGRDLAVCRIRRADLGLQMLLAGWAVAADPDDAAYRRAQRSARSRRQGLWRGRFERPTDSPCPSAAR